MYDHTPTLGPASEAPGGIRGAVIRRWFSTLNGVPLTTEQLDDAATQCLRELDDLEQ